MYFTLFISFPAMISVKTCILILFRTIIISFLQFSVFLQHFVFVQICFLKKYIYPFFKENIYYSNIYIYIFYLKKIKF